MSLLISEEELNERLENCEVVYHRMGKGSNGESRPRGEFNRVPQFVKELIVADVYSGAKKTEVADQWGISPRSVANFAEGRANQTELKNTDTALQTKAQEVADMAAKRKEEREEQLIEDITVKLMDAVKSVNIKADEKPIVQSAIARNLAGVLEKVKGPRQPNLNAGIVFHVHVPPKTKLEDFGEPITVIETEGKEVK